MGLLPALRRTLQERGWWGLAPTITGMSHHLTRDLSASCSFARQWQ